MDVENYRKLWNCSVYGMETIKVLHNIERYLCTRLKGSLLKNSGAKDIPRT